MMMKRMMIKSNNNNVYGRMSDNSYTTSSSTSRDEEVEWEMRPGGMLVQKRIGTDDNLAVVPNFRLRITFGELRYEISVNSQATFGNVASIYMLFYNV